MMMMMMMMIIIIIIIIIIDVFLTGKSKNRKKPHENMLCIEI